MSVASQDSHGLTARLGPEAGKALCLCLPAGQHPYFKDGSADNTYFTDTGPRPVSSLPVRRRAALDKPLKSRVDADSPALRASGPALCPACAARTGAAMPRLICFGEMLVRLTAPTGEMLLQTPRLAAHIGGAEANVAICVSRLGGEAGMASVLPDNALGRAARDELRRHGVDVSNLAFTGGRMGLYFVTPGAVTRPAEIVYDRASSAFALAAPSAIDWAAALKGAEWLHVSGINPAVSESAGKAALAAMQAAEAAGLSISYDGNYRTSLWKARSETGADILRRMLAHASLAFIDERDIALVLGTTFAGDADQRRRTAIDAAFTAFPKLQHIAHTSRDARGVNDHALGAALHGREGGTLSLEPITLPGIVDRMGGGDAFAGGLLYARMARMADAEAVAFALHSAAWKHGQSGDSSHASAEDIRALMSNGSLDVKR